MKKLFVSALAATMLTAPLATAQSAPVVPTVRADLQVQDVQYRPQRTEKRVIIKRGPNGQIVQKKVVKKRWVRGHRVPAWQRYRAVDYNRYHLRRPPAGHRWVRVDNDYLLIATATGLIASIIAAR